jgi:predicted nucleotide-binding protein
MDEPFLFVSYARADREPVRRIVEELRRLGVNVWIDAEQLAVGQSWQASINQALHVMRAILIFISPESMASRWTITELAHAIDRGLKVIPVLLRPTPMGSIPFALQRVQWLDLAKFPANTAAQDAAREIATILARDTSTALPVEWPDAEREGLAKALAAQTSGQQVETPNDDKPPTSVFVVHGHDEEFLTEVVTFIRSLGVAPIVMKDIGGAATSLIDRFFDIGGAAKFAIVLLSADDIGAARIQYEAADVGEKSLKFRSRQNVILELGFFYGFLGWDKVFVLEKPPARVFPDYERPSDLNGVLFDRFDRSGKWKGVIRSSMIKAGFRVPAA